jgi:cephalosporin hydroxylase
MKKIRNILYIIGDIFIGFYNAIFFWHVNSFESECMKQNELKELDFVKKRALSKETDIADHLENIFYESIITSPKLIVELGVRHGESTAIFDQVAKKCGSQHVSLDIDDCSNVIDNDSWIFVQGDDIEFSKRYVDWCKDKDFNHEIDVLFIDTSHTYQHTLQEMNHWFKFLSKNATVIFHDTNSNNVNRRKSGKLYSKINRYPQREVIQAIEEYFSCTFNEKEEFYTYKKDFLIKHYPYSFGLTVLRKIEQ